ncbi:peptidase M16 [Bacteroidota bacterium]|nr:peptidase M16 [Bacteroidota bacterium]
MIHYEKFTLDNGMRVLVHRDTTTLLAAFNLLYNVGARDETEDKTGFAHLFEHLMFGGSKNIPSFDEPLQRAGGENNAFTSNDITNYYETLPAHNLETAFWLESDRMLELDFEGRALEVQRKVVSEEFKEHYINQPYGDVWHKLRTLAYTTHTYRWPTIGKELSHIENATIDDVKNFFFKNYRPNNAILVVAGNVEVSEVKRLAEKYFGNIPSNPTIEKDIPAEPKQTEERKLEVRADVPLDALYKVYHMPGRLDKRYYPVDLLSDILSAGKSSRLYQSLVKEKKLFSEISAYITGSIDPGLFVFEGKLVKGVKMEDAEAAMQQEINHLMENGVDDTELEKVKNRVESQIEFAEMEVLHKAMSLAYAELLGDADLVNTEKSLYQKVTAAEIQAEAKNILQKENCSTLYYYAN